MPDIILCANHRLARHLRAEHDAAQSAAGHSVWQPLKALTLDVWLDDVITAALLSGTISAALAPRLILSEAQERLLWEQAIATDNADGANALFDCAGLAATAAEANQLCEVWNLHPDAVAGEETRRFLAWRRRQRAACASRGWLDAARYRAWQIHCLADGAGRLPASIAFAGFDRYSLQEEELKRVLAGRSVAVSELALARARAGEASVVACPDRRTECRAAAAWAAERLTRQADAHLGIVALDLAETRAMLAAALDDALHPDTLLAGNADLPRCYNFSLGAALARQPVAAVALELLQLCAQASTSNRRVDLARLGTLLLGPFWSAWQSEANDRARLDAAMRRYLPPTVGMPQWLAFVRRHIGKGLRLAQTVAASEALVKAIDANGRRRLPSDWAGICAVLLAETGWPGERTLSSHEWQASRALSETLQALGEFDRMLGKIALADAVAHLARLARERIFQPETTGTPNIQVMGPLEAAGFSFDALWVLGENDDVWPPAPRPNPLLPADLQRRARSANASAETQLEFARSIQRRLLHAADEIVFSWARAEDDRQLRPSPLLAGLPQRALPAPFVSVLTRQAGTGRIERLNDQRAPPLTAGEYLAGGTRLLQAQALCPAWAFYQFRLGAQPLAEPVAGMDAQARGTLLHRVMEAFFAGCTQAGLAAMSDAARAAAIQTAVTRAFAAFDEKREEKLPPRFAALEQTRLAQLLAQWLPLELARPMPFSVLASEQAEQVEIAGIAIDLRVDRIDRLADGRHLVIDYKTGRASTQGWQGERLADPQLPVYATQTGTPPAGVLFAQVRADGCRFIGWVADEGLAEGIEVIDWPAVTTGWHKALTAVATEIRDGIAVVSLTHEKDLQYCGVLPLLRLPEARMQRDGQ